jgi:hypothetical protein
VGQAFGEGEGEVWPDCRIDSEMPLPGARARVNFATVVINAKLSARSTVFYCVAGRVLVLRVMTASRGHLA